MRATPNPQINMSKIPVGGSILGGLAAAACMLIVFLGIPALWYAVPFVLGLGCVIALALRFTRRRTVGSPWILSGPDGKARKGERARDSDEPAGMRLLVPGVGLGLKMRFSNVESIGYGRQN